MIPCLANAFHARLHGKTLWAVDASGAVAVPNLEIQHGVEGEW